MFLAYLVDAKISHVHPLFRERKQPEPTSNPLLKSPPCTDGVMIATGRKELSEHPPAAFQPSQISPSTRSGAPKVPRSPGSEIPRSTVISRPSRIDFTLGELSSRSLCWLFLVICLSFAAAQSSHLKEPVVQEIELLEAL